MRALAVPLLLVLLLQPVASSFTVTRNCCCAKSGSCPLKKHSCSLRNLETDATASESRNISSPAEATFSLKPPLTLDAARLVTVPAPRDFGTPPDVPPPRV